jgi:hypothetical protein
VPGQVPADVKTGDRRRRPGGRSGVLSAKEMTIRRAKFRTPRRFPNSADSLHQFGVLFDVPTQRNTAKSPLGALNNKLPDFVTSQIRNPKYEIRKKLQIPSLKSQKSPHLERVLKIPIWKFLRISDFVLGISLDHKSASYCSARP